MKRIISLLAVLVLLFSAASAESSDYDAAIDALKGEYASEVDYGLLYDFTYNSENDCFYCHLTINDFTYDLFNSVDYEVRSEVYTASEALVYSVASALKIRGLSPSSVLVIGYSGDGEPIFGSHPDGSLRYDRDLKMYVNDPLSLDDLAFDIVDSLNNGGTDSVYSYDVVGSTLLLTQKMNSMSSSDFSLLPDSVKESLYSCASELVMADMDYLSACGIVDPFVSLTVMSCDGQILYTCLNGYTSHN